MYLSRQRTQQPARQMGQRTRDLLGRSHFLFRFVGGGLVSGRRRRGGAGGAEGEGWRVAGGPLRPVGGHRVSPTAPAESALMA